jgi:hypothetical protein
MRRLKIAKDFIYRVRHAVGTGAILNGVPAVPRLFTGQRGFANLGILRVSHWWPKEIGPQEPAEMVLTSFVMVC